MPGSAARRLHGSVGMGARRNAVTHVALCVAMMAAAPASAQTESALPVYAAPLFRVQGWVERVEEKLVTLRAPDGRPLAVDISELGSGFPAALTPGRLVGITVLALPDGSLSARSVTLDYEGPPPTGQNLD